jgi:hypothetical protein
MMWRITKVTRTGRLGFQRLTIRSYLRARRPTDQANVALRPQRTARDQANNEVILGDMSAIRLGSMALDCSDPAALGAFWSSLLDGEVAFANDEFVAVKTDRVWLTATRVVGYRPPVWPDGDPPKQVHLDLAVDDLVDAGQRAVELGATRADTQPAPDRYLVYLDPAGHPFCLSTQIPE